MGQSAFGRRPVSVIDPQSEPSSGPRPQEAKPAPGGGRRFATLTVLSSITLAAFAVAFMMFDGAKAAAVGLSQLVGAVQ